MCIYFVAADLRPKGRGRPQRILLGVWPDDHIKGVIRAVVFRDSHHIKEEPSLSYPRLHVSQNVSRYCHCQSHVSVVTQNHVQS